MNIIIKDTRGKNFVLNVTRNTTIRELKEKYANSLGLSFFDFIFKFNGNVLRNDKTLDYYEIEDGDTIITNFNKLMKIRIRNTRGEELISNVTGNMTIRQLKDIYANTKGLSSSDFVFKCDGMVMNNDKSLDYYEIEDGDVIIANNRVMAGSSNIYKNGYGRHISNNYKGCNELF